MRLVVAGREPSRLDGVPDAVVRGEVGAVPPVLVRGGRLTVLLAGLPRGRE